MSFLRDYLTYATGNEAPDMFHVLSGYFCLSAAVGRKVWLPFEDTAKYPNIYVILVGDAGNGKSWAMSKAKRLLSDLPHVFPSFSGSVETPQGLWRYVGGQPDGTPPVPSPVERLVKWADGVVRPTHPVTIIANEFINFISMDEKNWISALNDIYDSDHYHYRTKNGGQDSLLGPYVTMLGALTTEVSNDLQKTRIISTGLARRTIFQYGERKWLDPHPKPSFDAEAVAARVRALDHLKKLDKIVGAFSWSPEVDEYWTSWYRPHLAAVPQKPPQTKSWYASKADQVLKLAMLTCLSETGGLNLAVPHFELALSYLSEVERDLFKIFGGAGRNELAGVAVKIVEDLEKWPEPIARKRLAIRTYHLFPRDAEREFPKVLQYLLDDGQIMMATVARGPIIGEVVAVPRVMREWARANGVVLPGQHDSTQNGSHPGASHEVRPSSGPTGTLPVIPPPEVPTSAPPPSGSVGDPFQTPSPAED